MKVEKPNQKRKEKKRTKTGGAKNDIRRTFYTFNSPIYYYCSSIISGVSVLTHQKVSEEEKATIDDCIKFCFEKLDEMGVTFKFQNSMLYIAEKIDSRSDYLINMIEKAVDHAGGIENIYRRIA